MAQQKTINIGILGGGQLARMMVLKAHEMGMTVSVLSENENDPAAQVCPLWKKGSTNHAATLRTFLASVEVATFESEFLDAEILHQVSRAIKTPIFPTPRLMGQLQDRLTQKRLIVAHDLPTAAFETISTPSQAASTFDNFNGEVVFKKRRYGYDGYGTFVVRDKKSLAAFQKILSNEPPGFISEQFIPFKRELAIVLGRSRSGETSTFPFVETFQENARCLWVKGPLTPSKSLKSYSRRFSNFLDEIGYVGVMAFELFDTANGLLINELAPRVHNSAHYSQDAMSSDQFATHLKCVMGYNVEENPKIMAKGFAMLNLLGTSSKAPQLDRMMSDVKLHWYGKQENRPGRKMGHLNAVGSSPQEALDRLFKRRGDLRV